MEGYFILVSDSQTLERLQSIDVADEGAALDIYNAKVKEGFNVSVWKAMRIRVHNNG